jgi:hypothetical protein
VSEEFLTFSLATPIFSERGERPYALFLNKLLSFGKNKQASFCSHLFEVFLLFLYGQKKKRIKQFEFIFGKVVVKGDENKKKVIILCF